MTMSILLAVGGCALLASVAYALSRRDESQSKSPLETAVNSLPVDAVSMLIDELQIASYPAFAAVEAVRYQGMRPSKFSTSSKSELVQKLSCAVEDLLGAIQHIRLYNAIELSEFERKPEQILHEMRAASAEESGFISTLLGVVEYQLSPPEREELARIRTQQVVSRNRRVLLDLASAETVCKQGQDFLVQLANSPKQAA